ncbi:NAD(P)-binding domain [Trinorchestia longiramus]|nr:NAD(P)-binding domain [Trinorchestia longiramus]
MDVSHALQINNAGLLASKKTLTEDGLELTMQSNHFGHFLLTNMLGLLKAGAPSRIVCVSSNGHTWATKFDPEDLDFHHIPYSSMKAYALSKLCNVLMAGELSTRLKGIGVTAYSLHPGVVMTEIILKDPSSAPFWKIALVSFLKFLSVLFIPVKNPEEGAQTTIYCAVDDAVADQSGLYYSDCKMVPASEAGRNHSYAAKLWAASESAVNLTAQEANI